MGLDALLTALERRAVTCVTPCYPPRVTANTASMQACTPVTSVTPENNGAAGDAAAPNPYTQSESPEPTAPCAVCGWPSWWFSGNAWCCGRCTPRPEPFLGASLTI